MIFKDTTKIKFSDYYKKLNLLSLILIIFSTNEFRRCNSKKIWQS